MILHAIGIDVGRIETKTFLVEKRRVVAQKLVVEIVVDGIEPETVHAAIQPEAHGFEKSILNLGIVKIQVRLRGEEAVHVILLAHAVPFPGRSAEHGKPVCRRRAIRLGIGPDIPVGLAVGAAGTAVHEPGMLI
ncbi:hypothetical protein D3C86_1272730 [compost metagenome]